MNFENRISVYISSIICGSFFIFIFFVSEGFTKITSFGEIILLLIILSIVFFIPYIIIKGFFWVKKAYNKNHKDKVIFNSSISEESDKIIITPQLNKKKFLIVILCIIFITFVFLYKIFNKIDSLEQKIDSLEQKIDSLEDEINNIKDEIDNIKDKINY